MEKMNVGYTGCSANAKSSIIVLPTCKGILVIRVQEIIRIQSISNYSKLFFKDGKTLVVAKVLHWFQEQASLFSFIRIHRTHFVNINYIKSYGGSKSGLLLLLNGEIFSVARRKKAVLTGWLKNFNNFFAGAPAAPSSVNTYKILAA